MGVPGGQELKEEDRIVIVSRRVHISPPPLVSAAPGAPLKTAIEPDGVDFSLLSPACGYRPALLSVFLIRLFFTSAGMASTAAAVGSAIICMATQATPAPASAAPSI